MFNKQSLSKIGAASLISLGYLGSEETVLHENKTDSIKDLNESKESEQQ